MDNSLNEQKLGLFTRLNLWLTAFFTKPEQPEPPLEPILGKQLLFEFGIIFIAITIYCLGFLDFGTNNPLPGNESEVFQSLDKILEVSLKKTGEFPLWNPYFEHGFPFIADPMLHVFNPLFSIPVLLFGTLNGFKLGLYFSFLAAGFGMWWFGRILGMKAPSRVWIALMYAFAGPPVARFFQGQYLFTAGYGLLAWGLAGVIAAYKYQKPAYIGLAVLSLSLLFFTGNIYYPYYFVYVLILFGILFLFNWKDGKLSINRRLIKTYGFIGLLALGLISIQLIPLYEFHSWFGKSHLEITNSHTFYQIWLDLTSNITSRMDAKIYLPPEEYYAYIGFWPFYAIFALCYAWKPFQRRLITFFIVLILFASCWINFEQMPWKDYLLNSHFFSQFRYPTRYLVFIILALIVLAGLSIDALLGKLTGFRKNHNPKSIQYKFTGFFIFGILLLMLTSIVDVFSTNKYLINTIPPNSKEDNISLALREYDPGFYSVGTSDNRWHLAMLENLLPHSDLWYHFSEIRNFKGTINKREIITTDNYRILDVVIPQPENSKVVKKFKYTIIYEIPDSLPFAFSIPANKLLVSYPKTPIQRNEVTPFDQVAVTFNKIEITAQAKSADYIVILETFYPGWQLRIDNAPAKIENVSGFMAATMLPGTHHYVFSFRPVSFYIGLSISLVSLFILIFIFSFENKKKHLLYVNLLQKNKSLSWIYSLLKTNWVTGDELIINSADDLSLKSIFRKIRSVVSVLFGKIRSFSWKKRGTKTKQGIVNQPINKVISNNGYEKEEGTDEESSENENFITVTNENASTSQIYTLKRADNKEIQVTIKMPVGTRVHITIEASEDTKLGDNPEVKS